MYHGLSLSRRHSTATRNVGTRGGFLYLHGQAAQNHLPLRPLVPRQEFGALSVWVAEGPGDKWPRDSGQPGLLCGSF